MSSGDRTQSDEMSNHSSDGTEVAGILDTKGCTHSFGGESSEAKFTFD